MQIPPFIQQILLHPWAFWIILAVISGILEMLLPSFSFVFACFAALPTALASRWLGWEAQAAIFTGMLALSWVFFRPRLMERFHIKTKIPSRTQVLLGKKGSVTEAIDPVTHMGRVLVEGQDWAARCAEPIAAGLAIEVEDSDGIVLIVKPIVKEIAKEVKTSG